MGNLIKDFWTYEYKDKKYFGIVEVIKGSDISQKRNVIKYETHIEKALDYTMNNDVTSHISIQTFCTWLKNKSNRADNEQRYYPFTIEFEPKEEGKYMEAAYEAAIYAQYLNSELGINKEDILIMINNSKSIYVQVNPKAYDLRPDHQLNRIYFEMYKKIKKELNFKNVDESIVSSSYKVMKAPNSFYKGGYFVRVSIEELMKVLTGTVTKKKLTAKKRSLNIDVPGEISLKAVRFYRNALKQVKTGKVNRDVKDNDTNIGGSCVKYLLTHMIEKGYRNYGLVSVAIYLKSLGYTKEETLKNLEELAESWGHDESNRQIKSKVETVYRRNYRFSCEYTRNVFEEAGINNICNKCPFSSKNKLQLIKENTFDIDQVTINRLWANKASTRHYLLYLKLQKEGLFNININTTEKNINIRTLKELSKAAGFIVEKVEGLNGVVNIKYIPSKRVYRLPEDFIDKTALQLGESLKQYLKLFVKGYKAIEKYMLIRSSKENLMYELGYKDISSLYKLLNKLKNIGLIKVHNNSNYTLYYKSYKVIEISTAVEELQEDISILRQAVGQGIEVNNSRFKSEDNYKEEQQKFNIGKNNSGKENESVCGNKDLVKFLERNKYIVEKYKRLTPTLNELTGRYYFKYAPLNLEDWIKECRIMNLSKEMVILNTKKYGYMDSIFYILRKIFD